MDKLTKHYVALKGRANKPKCVVHIARTDRQTWCKFENGTRKALIGFTNMPIGRVCINCKRIMEDSNYAAELTDEQRQQLAHLRDILAEEP